MFNLLADALLPNWVINSFPVIKFILLCLIVLAAVALIVIVLLQDSEGDATSNAITGIKDTYYSQNKGGSREGRITRWIYICVGCIAVLCILYFITLKIYRG